MPLVTCVPAAERVEPVHSCDPKLLSWLGTRQADGDGAQAQTLVVTETRLLHQLLHGGLLRGSQSAAGQRFTIIRYWNISMQSCVFCLTTFFCHLHLYLPRQLFIFLTRDVIIFVPGHSAASVIFLQCTLAAATHGNLSSPLCTLHNSFGQCSGRSTIQLLVVLICDNSSNQLPVFALKQNIP